MNRRALLVALLSAITVEAFVGSVRPSFLLASSAKRQSTTKHVLFMGSWGPEPIWTAAKVTSNVPANKSGKCVSINVELDNPDVVKEYKIPGQYVQVRLNEETKPLFLAIASPPPSTTLTDDDTKTFEFLIKKTNDNEWMTTATSGAQVQISQVLGGGFPMEENLEGIVKYDFPTQNIILFCVGSGIAPIKAAMESGQLGTTSNGRSARLYYGVQTPDDLCFVDKFSEWEQGGFEVVPVMSQPTDSWEGRSGYVQNALEEDGVPIPRNSGALLCGMKGMAESVKTILLKAGMFEGRILTNF